MLERSSSVNCLNTPTFLITTGTSQRQASKAAKHWVSTREPTIKKSAQLYNFTRTCCETRLNTCTFGASNDSSCLLTSIHWISGNRSMHSLTFDHPFTSEKSPTKIPVRMFLKPNSFRNLLLSIGLNNSASTPTGMSSKSYSGYEIAVWIELVTSFRATFRFISCSFDFRPIALKLSCKKATV